MMTMRKYLILFLFLVGGFVLCVPSILRASELQENHIVKTIDDNSVVKMSNAESTIYQNSVRKIARGESHTIVVRNDGTVWSWGENNCGALGVGDSVEASDIPLQVIDLTNIIKVSASRFSTIALKEDGTVWYWGNYYDYHRGYYKEAYVPIQFTNFNDVVDIVCSDDYIVALKADGSVWQYGRSFYTCTGSFEKVIDLPKVSKLAISIDNTMAAITDNGEAWIWGEDYQSPTQINVNSAVSISVDNEVVVAKSDGTVWVFDNIKASGYQLDTSNVAIVDGAGVYLQILKNDGTMEFWLKHYGKWGLAAAQHFAYDDIVASSGYSGGTTILRQDGTVWQLEESYTSIIDDNVMVKSEGDLPFWWTGYYVSYDENGGFDAPDKQIKGPGVVLQLTDAIPSREGFVFKGWSTSPNGKVLYTPSSNYEVDSDIMLYAIWEPGYAIVYEVNGYYDVIEMQIKKKGEPLLLDASIHRSGNKLFAGWATKADGDVVYAPGALYKEDVAITLHARWILEETEECSCKNGYLSSDCSSCNSGKITTTYDCLDCGGSGKVNKEKETTAQCQICHGIGLSWSLTLQDYVRCAFCSGTGEFTYTDIVEVRCSRCSGSGIGYGQATCSECSGSGKKFRDCPDCTVAGIKILNEEYRLSYNANGGENAPYGKTNYVGVSVCISSEIPKRFRYTFEGWSLQADGEVVYRPGDTYLGEESVVLYAVWRENKCQDDMHIFSYNQGLTCEYCGFSKQPPKPQLQSKTVDSISLVECENCEYSMDGEIWQDVNVFAGLVDNKAYTFYQRVKNTSISLVSEKSEGLTVYLKKVQEQPSAPIISSYTDTTVTLISITNGEYSADGDNWQTSNVFENLWSATQYTFYQRYAETDTHEASESSSGTSITTDKSKQTLVPNAPTIQSVTADSITLTHVEGCEYSKNGTTWQSSNVFSGLSCGTEYTFHQRYMETLYIYEGESSTGTVAKTNKGTQTAPPQPILLRKTHTSVTLREYSGYEYSRDGITWQFSNVFRELSPETNYMFYQRKVETDIYYASEASSSLIVKTNERPPECEVHTYGDDSNDICTACYYERQLSGISVKTMPNKTEYVIDESLETQGLVLIAEYSDGTKKSILTDYQVEGYDSASAGVKELTISHGGKLTTMCVTVKEESSINQFVIRLYEVCLNRTPDSMGKADWSNRLERGESSGIQAAYGFIFSNEFKGKNLCNEDYIEQLYNAFMGRGSDSAGKAGWVGQLNSGSTREAIFNGFAFSPEFQQLCTDYGIRLGEGIFVPTYGTVPTGCCNVCGKEDGVTGFVKRLYQVCLGRVADPVGLADWTNRLWNHTASGSGTAYGFIFSNEFISKNHNNEDYVEYLYNAFMGRGSDPIGKAGWVNQLNSGSSRYDVFNGFVGSQEFMGICNSYGIVR